jgi:hypothetical protein
MIYIINHHESMKSVMIIPLRSEVYNQTTKHQSWRVHCLLTLSGCSQLLSVFQSHLMRPKLEDAPSTGDKGCTELDISGTQVLICSSLCIHTYVT